MKACILDYQSLRPEDLDLSRLMQLSLNAGSEHATKIEWQLYDTTQAEQTLARIQGQEIILTNKVVINAEHLAANPQLKLIIILATGTNNVDLDAAKAQGVAVANIVAYSTESVVQQTFAMLLALATELPAYDKAVRAGRWSQSDFFGLHDFQSNEIAGKTLGIIGYGAIGQRVKTVAEAFAMKVIVAESLSGAQHSDRVSLERLYREADVISIHSPLTAQSTNLIDAKALVKMKPSAILLNLGRGGIVNETDLLSALQQGVIKAAALDVLSQEPPQAEHPLIQANLANLIIMPHTAWASRQARQQLLDQVVDILQSLTTDKLKNRVV